MNASANRRPPLSSGALLVRGAGVCVAIAALAGAFAFAGGWLSPGRLAPAKISEAFETSDGTHAGFRRNHAKGVCVSGMFEPSGAGERLSKAIVFKRGTTVPVVGRFSIGGGMPTMDDAQAAARGLGLQFSPEGAQPWRTAMINLPVFIVRTPEAFYERLTSAAPDPKTGKPDPAKMEAFVKAHPEFLAAIEIIKKQPPPAGFAETTFHGLNAFYLVADQRTPVRWQLEPEPSASADASPTTTQAAKDPNFLFNGIIDRIARGPAKWHLIVIVGQPGDPTNDATLPWPDSRERVDVGTLTLDRVEAESDTKTADLNFDPLVLPDGIEPSDDPLLSARSAAYADSMKRRAGGINDKAPSAITHDDVAKGGMH